MLIVGGTGRVGTAVAAQAVERGHEVVALSRHAPAEGSAIPGVRYVQLDLLTAVDFDEAMEGVDVLVDTTDGVSRASGRVFTQGSANLLHAAARWGIARAVLLSIVNVDRCNLRYYRTKTAQESAYRESVLETRIVRATQFHDLVTGVFRTGAKGGIVPAFGGVRLQPIAIDDVASILVDTAEGAGRAETTFTVGGPEVLSFREMAAQWKAATGSRGLVLRLRMPGAIGAFWRSGGALIPEHAVGLITYRQWLQARERA
ncbi:NAD(P)H-binding protein [Microbacterium sp. STN6]|uniref:SDR family oxidoreductase n=1 Tax=Microbacterium sp. STN6 TaxID=2995588 RepID=UPI002260CAB7|nr:NAD(P)H-binding protein [Microbacterium sp. STN6]MCX7522145.1 NAD(P)H-binding protein [Microbacterium sp. STN6]